MNEFSRPLPPYRLATINHGDDMKSIASRELGDANRWTELVYINSLVWPYVTDDPRRVTTGVLLSGNFIRIPAPVGTPTTGKNSIGQVFERDCQITNGQLRENGSGDFAVVSGSDNLVQQLSNRLDTPRGQLMRHPKYGSLLYRLIGKVNGPTANLLAAQFTEATLLSDYRVSSAQDINASVIVPDQIKVTGTAVTIAGGTVDVATTV